MEDKDELIKAQNEVIGILFEVIKKLQENIDLQEEGVQLIIKSKDDDLEENKSIDIIKLKCNHMYHKGCIDPWIKINKNCPLCKRIIM